MKNVASAFWSMAGRPSMARPWTAFLLSLVLTLPAPNAAAAETWALPTPRGAIQPGLIEAPDRPKAAVVLFAGGDGGVFFVGDRPTRYRGNFLVRSRDEFL